jgi:hypothetical protein
MKLKQTNLVDVMSKNKGSATISKIKTETATSDCRLHGMLFTHIKLYVSEKKEYQREIVETLQSELTTFLYVLFFLRVLFFLQWKLGPHSDIHATHGPYHLQTPPHYEKNSKNNFQ